MSANKTRESRKVTLVLSVSDTTFSYDAIEAYRAELDLFKTPKIVNLDSVGPFLFLWICNEGPDAFLTVNVADDQIDMACMGHPDPLEIELSIDGKFVNNTFRSMLILPSNPPCANYSRCLVLFKSGEMKPLHSPINLLAHLPDDLVKAGTYDVTVVMRSVCTTNDSKNIWEGVATSNKISFRIVKD